jgi:ankyrin repeat protein
MNYPLHYAARNNNYDLIKDLIKTGIDINKKDDEEYTALYYACNNDAYESVELLIELGADINLKLKYRDFPIHTAINNKSLKIAELLIQNGANVRILGAYRNTVLHRACELNATRIIKMIIKRVDIDVQNNNDNTPLHYAAYNNSYESVQILIDNGAFLNIRNEEGLTPLHYAINNNSYESLRIIINNTKDIYYIEDEEYYETYNETYLDYATKKKSIECVKIIIEKYKDIEFKNKYGLTSFHYAIIFNYFEIVKLFIKNNFNIYTPNSENYLHFAIKHKSLDIINILIENKKKINIEIKQFSYKPKNIEKRLRIYYNNDISNLYDMFEEM